MYFYFLSTLKTKKGRVGNWLFYLFPIYCWKITFTYPVTVDQDIHFPWQWQKDPLVNCSYLSFWGCVCQFLMSCVNSFTQLCLLFRGSSSLIITASRSDCSLLKSKLLEVEGAAASFISYSDTSLLILSAARIFSDICSKPLWMFTRSL